MKGNERNTGDLSKGIQEKDKRKGTRKAKRNNSLVNRILQRKKCRIALVMISKVEQTKGTRQQHCFRFEKEQSSVTG